MQQEFIAVSSVSCVHTLFLVHASSLLVQLKTCRVADFEEQVKEFSAKLALVPIPPPGQLQVVGCFRLKKKSFFVIKFLDISILSELP